MRGLLVVTLLSMLALAPCARANPNVEPPRKAKDDVSKIGDRDVDGGVNFYSIEKEIAIGRQMAQEIEKTAKIIDDPVVSEYVNRVGQNLVRNSDAKVPFTIKVIDNEEINAFALPGGFFYVNSGLVLLAESEAELAGVMAHEIAHVTARHGTRQATRGQIFNLASIPLIFMGGWTGYGVRQAAGFAIPMTFLKFSREMEKEADYLGLQYLYATGYDPNAMITFFERIQAQQKRKQGAVSKAFSSHPPTGKRIKLIQESMEEILPSRPQYMMTSSEFHQVKDRLAQLTQRSRRESDDPSKPTLRRAPSGDTIDPGEAEDDEDDRPILKRKDGGEEEEEETTTSNGA